MRRLNERDHQRLVAPPTIPQYCAHGIDQLRVADLREPRAVRLGGKVGSRLIVDVDIRTFVWLLLFAVVLHELLPHTKSGSNIR